MIQGKLRMICQAKSAVNKKDENSSTINKVFSAKYELNSFLTNLYQWRWKQIERGGVDVSEILQQARKKKKDNCYI